MNYFLRKIFQGIFFRSSWKFFSGTVLLLGGFYLFSAPPANAANELNTLSFFVGQNIGSVAQNTAVEDDANTAGMKNFTFFIGDDVDEVRSVFFEISGVSDATASNSIKVSVNDSSFSQTWAKTFVLNATGRKTPFKLLYDASCSTCIKADIVNTGRGTYGPYTLNIKTQDAAVSLWSARMMVSYRHNAPSISGTNELNTLSFFVGQNIGSVAQNTAVEDDANTAGMKNFTFFIGDDVDEVRSVFFEISGVSDATASNSIKVSVNDSSFSQTWAKTFVLNATGRKTPFKLLYDASCSTCIKADIVNTGRGTYGPYTLNIKTQDAAVSLWSATLMVTYRQKPGGGGSGVPAIGYYESPIFEATTGGESSGIKSGFNALNWTETKSPTQRVKFQIATCDSVTGSICNDGGGWSYKGPDGSTGTYYGYDEVGFGNYCSGSSGAYTCRISQDHNNKRYFRYKITLCSSGDCSSSGATSPKVEKVILNWSP